MRLYCLPVYCFAVSALAGETWLERSTDTVSQHGTNQLGDFLNQFILSWKEQNPGLNDTELSQMYLAAGTLKNHVQNLAPRKNNSADIIGTLHHQNVRVQRRSLIEKRLNSSTDSYDSILDEARTIVREAQKAANLRNKERFKNPRINSYYDNLHLNAAIKARAEDMESLTVNNTVADAAALVAEADASNSTNNDNSKYSSLPSEIADMQRQMFGPTYEHDGFKLTKRTPAENYWLEHIDHVGKVPYGGSANDDYKVFRNVKDYGAKGDGITDDTKAINKAMADQGRCGANCGSSTVKPALVYFPPGVYLVSSSVIMYYNTQMVGNALDRPVIKAATSFVGLGVVTSDVYTGGNGGADQWYINQNNFLRQLRNFIIDVTEASMTDIAGLHWQVAQGTSIHRVTFKQSSSDKKNHIGIFAENGSGGFMSDVQFYDGGVGIRCGNQQFTTRNFAFIGCRVAIDLLWDWGWTWKSLYLFNVQIGFKMSSTFRGGSTMVLDSILKNVDVGFLISSPPGKTASEKFSISLQNLDLYNVGKAAMHTAAGQLLAGGTKKIESWVSGKVYDKANPKGIYQNGAKLSEIHPNTGSLFSGRGYFEREKPTYVAEDASSFINARTLAKGDGVTDDTFALSFLLATAKYQNKILYIPMGSYIVTKTIMIPAGSRIVGECWSQIVAKGQFFADVMAPNPLVQVGQRGEKGSVEIQDLLFTVEGAAAGAILMEWNIAQDERGSAAMWDTHFRIGGAAGSHLQRGNCPKLTGSVNKNCMAGSVMLRMTPTSSGYLENVWAWVADHDLDSGVDQTQIDIYVGRGILIESKDGPVWLYGTSSEHTVLYQYMVYGASNVFMGMIQTESPYFLPKPQAPAPFTKQVGFFAGDPEFQDCDAANPHCAAAWGLAIIGSTNVHVLGAGMYNWFQDYTQPCVDGQDCQQRVLNVERSGQIWLYHIYTIGTVEMLNHESSAPILAKTNTNTNDHPFTSIINAWLLASSGRGDGGYVPAEDDEESFDPLPECTGTFSSISQLMDAYVDSRVSEHCIDIYLVQAESKMLRQAISDYDVVMAQGYDQKFEVYAANVKEQAPMQVKAYMKTAQASGAWSCTKTSSVTCCSECGYIINCPADCNRSKDCKPGKRQVPADCPNNIQDATLSGFASVPEYTYTLLDEDKFYTSLENEYGIIRSWIELGDRTALIANGCQMAKDVLKCNKEQNTFWHNYPLLSNIRVPNPKEVVQKSRSKSQSLLNDMEEASISAKFHLETSYHDLADSMALPALMMQHAIEEMKRVMEVADKVIEEQRKQTIAAFVSAIFCMVPFAGEAAGFMGGALLRTIVTMAGELGNLAFTMYDTITEPDNAIVNILGLLTGGMSRQPFKDAALSFRSMPKRQSDKLGKKINLELAKVQQLRNRCAK